MTLLFCILWIALLLLSCVLAGFMIHRQGTDGMRFAVLAVGGVLLCWSLVSAGIGWQEIDEYTTTLPFMISMIVGTVGMVALATSLLGLRGGKYPPKKTTPEKTEKKDQA